MISLQAITYRHPNKDILFQNLNMVVNRYDKIALIGNNGIGKSTLLKLLAGELKPSEGIVKTTFAPYYVPQIYGQFNNYTIARALLVEHKLAALREILSGQVTAENMGILNDDWMIEDRCREALAHWQLAGLTLDQKMSTLSGGQKTKVFLAGITIHKPEIVLLDEPSNHLDNIGRELLYDYLKKTGNTLVMVSHDRHLLNLSETVYELSKAGISTYGGNYDFYITQKNVETEALNNDLKAKEKALRKAREKERESIERQQKLDARGKKKQEKAGLPTISMNTLRNTAERSTSRMKGVHEEKVDAISEELYELRKGLPDVDKMKVDLDNSALHIGKVLVKAIDINYSYKRTALWNAGISFEIRSGERVAVNGGNGSGKTTLVKMMLGLLEPTSGSIVRTDVKAIYIDQDYSLIDNGLTVYEQAELYNTGALQEHEIKIRLDRFLFTSAYWDKPCKTLSGGEKMRLILCCFTIGNKAPDIIVLDEPTNNLDIQNTAILTAAINGYKGTLIVISHDAYFLEEINAGHIMTMQGLDESRE